MFKRVLSFLLALVVTLSMVPVGAFAAETEGDDSDMNVEISRDAMASSSLAELYAGSTVGVTEEALEPVSEPEPSTEEVEEPEETTEQTTAPLETEATVEDTEVLSDGDWLYRLDEEENAVVTGYLDTGVRSLSVPYTLEDRLVVALDDGALAELTSLSSIEIHGSVTSMGTDALPADVTVIAYHGAEALNYAEQNGLKAENLSQFYFVDGVVDYSDIPAGRYAFAGDTTIRMRHQEASRLEVGSVFYLPSSEQYLNGEGFVVESMEDLGDWVELRCRVARGTEIIYRMVAQTENMEIDWDNIVVYEGVTITQAQAPAYNGQEKGLHLNPKQTLKISMEENILNMVTFAFIEGEATFGSSMAVDVNLLTGQVNELSFLYEETFTGKGGIKISSNGIFPGGEIAMPIGVIPMKNAFFSVDVKVGVKFETSGAIVVEFSSTTKKGLEWDNSIGDFVQVDEFNQDIIPLKGEGEFSFSIFSRLDVSVIFLGEIANLELALSFELNLEVPLTTKQFIQDNVTGNSMEIYYPLICIDYTGEIKAELTASVEIGAMDDSVEVSFEAMNLELYKKDLGSTHYEMALGEDTFQQVDDCLVSAYVKVNFHVGAGSDYKIAQQQILKGGKVKLPSEILHVHKNYTFLGWFTEDDMEWDFDAMTVEQDLELYAHWDVESETDRHYTQNLAYSVMTNVLNPEEKTGIEITGVGEAKGVTNLVIPPEIAGLSVKRIRDSAFKNEVSIESVYIPPTVETIGFSAFEGCSSLSEVDLSLAEGLKTISMNAFSGTAITEVFIPRNIQYLAGFEDCPELRSVVIDVVPVGLVQTPYPEIAKSAFGSDKLQTVDLGNVYKISGLAFNSTSLETIEIPGRTAQVSGESFAGLPNLKEILVDSRNQSYIASDGILFTNYKYLPNYVGLIAFPGGKMVAKYEVPANVRYLDNYAFTGAQVTNLKLHNQVEEIGAYAFSNSSLETIVLSSAMKTIPMGAFENCTKLQHITLPDSVTSVYMGAFKGSGLRSADLSKGMSKVSISMFQGCGELRRVEIPDGYTAIEMNAFDGCYSLESLYIPPSVTTIDETALQSVLEYQQEHQNDPGAHVLKIYGKKDSYAETWAKAHGVPFYDKVGAPERYKLTWETNGGSEVPSQMKYAGMKILVPADPVRLGYIFAGWYEDQNCIFLWDFENKMMPDEDTTIYARWEFARNDYHYTLNAQEGEFKATFDYYDGPLDTILVPETIDGFTVTAIGPNAFSHANPKKIILPATVTAIDKTAFFGCKDLQEIQLDAASTAFVMTSNTLYSADKTQLIRVLPDPIPPQCGSISATYTIPNTVTEVYPYAFQNCDYLTTVSVSTLTPKLQTIGKRAFALCSELKKVTLPKTITQLEEDVFYGCHKDLQVFAPWANLVISQYMHDHLIDYNLYRLTYMMNGKRYYSMNVEAGTLISGILEPKEDMMTFGGVYTDYNCTKPWDFTTDLMPDRNLTLYVKYTSDLEYTGTDELTITGYTGTDSVIVIPQTINGNKVVGIAAGALSSSAEWPLSEITLGSHITNIAPGAITWEGEAQKPVIFCDADSAAAAYCADAGLTMKKIRYVITWQAEGARLADPITGAEPGTVLSAPGFIRDNYALEGWYTDASLTKKWDFAVDTVGKENLVLYAKMQKVDPSIEDLVFSFRCENGEVTVTSYNGSRNFATIPSAINGEPVTAIGDFFLQGNAELQILTIPETVTSIGRYAFQNSALNKVQFTGDASAPLTMGEGAFNGCHRLQTLYLGRRITELPANVFLNCSNIRSITLPDSLQSIGEGAFGGCGSLLSIQIPAAAAEIQKRAFASCTSLKEVLFQGDCPSIHETAFQYTSKSLALFYPNAASGWEGLALNGITAIPIDEGGYIDSLAPDRSRVAVGQSVEWFANAEGEGPFRYRFELYRQGETKALLVKDYSSAYTFCFTPEQAGTYRLKVTAKGPGGALTSSRESAVEVFENVIPIRKIELSHQSLTLRPGASVTLGTTIYPSIATQQDLVWISSNPGVATVENGIVTAVAMGTTTICVADGNGHMAQCMLIVTIPSDPVIDLILPGTEVGVGKTLQLIAQCEHFAQAQPALLWFSSDEAVASVDANGLVTGVSAGDVTITVSATDGSGAFNRIDLTVLPAKVESISITAPEFAMIQTEVSLSAVVLPDYASERSVTWSITEGEEFASIEGATGLLTAGDAKGTVTVRATANDGSGVYGEAKIIIQNCRLTIDGEGITELTSGQKLQLTAACEPEDTQTGSILWTSSDPAAASVNADGLVTARNVEKTTVVQITARAEQPGIADAVCSITIRPKTKKLTITGETEVDLGNGKTVQLTASAEPEDASTAVTWKSSNPSIADVSSTGLVTFEKAGKVTITATAADGSRKTGKITLNGVFLISGIQLTVPEDQVYSGKSLQLTASVQPDNATNRKLIWTVDDSDAASISSSGKLTAKKVQEPTAVTVTVTAADSGKAVATKTITLLSTQIALREQTGSLVTGKTISCRSDAAFRLTADMNKEPLPVTWKSSKESIATIDETGNVTFHKSGTVTLTATDAQKRTAKVTVKVMVPAETVTIASKTGASVVASGKKLALTALVEPLTASQRNVQWTIEKGPGKISTSGAYTAPKDITQMQEVVVRATAKDGFGAYGEFTIRVYPIAAKVTLSGAPEDGKIPMGQALTLTSKVTGDKDLVPAQDVLWTASGGAASIEVTEEGCVVTPVKPGSVTVKATAADGSGKSASVKLTVVQPMRKLTVPENQVLAFGKKYAFKPVIEPSNTTNKKLTYILEGGEADSKGNYTIPGIAKLTASGVLTADKNLTNQTDVTVKITAQDGSGLTAGCTVSLWPIATKVTIQGMPQGNSVTMGQTVSLTALVTGADGNMPAQAVTWKLSSDKFADIAVTETGCVITPKQSGTVTIKATAADGSGRSASVKLTIKKQ